MTKVSKRLNAKVDKLVNNMLDLNKDLFFQALPGDCHKDFNAMVNAAKVFRDNLPQKKEK